MPSACITIRLRRAGLAACTAAIACVLLQAGCASIKTPNWKTPTWPWSKAPSAEKKLAGELGEDADSSVISSEFNPTEQDFGWDYFKGQNIKKRWKKMVGRGPNEPVSRKALAEGDSLFRDRKYSAAAKKYKTAVDRWPDSVIEEDALWQLAECWFFMDHYPKAEDCYDELVKKYANSRYLDRIAQRQFVIAQYWIALDQKHNYMTIVPNLADRSRPLFDTRGRALKAYDHVRINDPRGPLADDSIMAAANAHFVDRQWLDADYFYGLLRNEYPPRSRRSGTGTAPSSTPRASISRRPASITPSSPATTPRRCSPSRPATGSTSTTGWKTSPTTRFRC